MGPNPPASTPKGARGRSLSGIPRREPARHHQKGEEPGPARATPAVALVAAASLARRRRPRLAVAAPTQDGGGGGGGGGGHHLERFLISSTSLASSLSSALLFGSFSLRTCTAPLARQPAHSNIITLPR
jgi:hypothetical protein